MMDDIKQDFNNDLKNIKIEMAMSIHSEPSEESSVSQSSELCKAEGTQTTEEHDQSISVMDGMKQDLMSDLKNNLKIEKMDWPIQSETPENSSVSQSSKLFLAGETQKKILNQEITFSQDVYTRITPNKESSNCVEIDIEEIVQSISVMEDDMKHDFTNDLKKLMEIEKIGCSLHSTTPENICIGPTLAEEIEIANNNIGERTNYSGEATFHMPSS
ncbi:zinc finger protein 493-like isoform X3 [Biomphalaria pfeifferi]|uniref:Zinc finger protein 493-like isoform X3 n=1 Tax=Biomphalaria pfeifferi TaxID=112525 RepID=A0AAD8FHV6_BIOPF|nr:zinc finger protein 493-like isoform X3 [Biomphalaria pfeifferi]